MNTLIKELNPFGSIINSDKITRLEALMETFVREGALVTFSGGLDSAFLLWFAQQTLLKINEGKVVALTTNSASMPEKDKSDAEAFTSLFDIPHIWRESHEMDNPLYLANDAQRCYHCKQELFNISGDEIEKLGLKWILYGYNATDKSDFRPGHRAAIENNVQFPLAEVGITKEEMRIILKNEGIEIADKAASPCLSSRISHGIMVTSGKLADIAAMEKILHQADIKICRVRINESNKDLFLRIEVSPDEIARVIEIKNILEAEGKKRGYKWITLDLSGYRTGGGAE